jgi:hypothetical protein
MEYVMTHVWKSLRSKDLPVHRIWWRLDILIWRLYPDRKHIHLVRFEVFTAVTVKNGVFWDVTPHGSCKNRFQRTLALPSLLFLVVPSSHILVTLMKEALSSSGTSVLTRATGRNLPEDAILHIHLDANFWFLWQNRSVRQWLWILSYSYNICK